MVARPVGQVLSSEPKRRPRPLVERTKLTQVERHSVVRYSFVTLLTVPKGTDHQRIVKLDRENEVAPPSKVAPSVGRVRVGPSPCRVVSPC